MGYNYSKGSLGTLYVLVVNPESGLRQFLRSIQALGVRVQCLHSVVVFTVPIFSLFDLRYISEGNPSWFLPYQDGFQNGLYSSLVPQNVFLFILTPRSFDVFYRHPDVPHYPQNVLIRQIIRAEDLLFRQKNLLDAPFLYHGLLSFEIEFHNQKCCI